MNRLKGLTKFSADRSLLVKLGETAVFVLLLPVPVIGLICLCALLGYLAEIVRNVSNGYPRPLPAWNHIGEDISKGLPVFIALLLYHLPPLLALAFLYAFRGVIAVSLFGGITFVGIVTSLMPLLLVYLAFAWSLFALALSRYAETWQSDSFYQFNRLLRTLQINSALTLKWLISSLAASIVLLALSPLLLLGPILFVPVQGLLLGRFARRLRIARNAYLHAVERDSHGPAMRYQAADGHRPLHSNQTV